MTTTNNEQRARELLHDQLGVGFQYEPTEATEAIYNAALRAVQKALASRDPEPQGEVTQDRGNFDPAIHVPGVWRCAKCDFQLIQSNLNARDGTVTPRDDAGDKCPNDGAPLWRVTWKEYAEEGWKRAEEAHERFQSTGAGEVERAIAKTLEMVTRGLRGAETATREHSDDVADGLLGVIESITDRRDKMISDVRAALLSSDPPSDGEAK